MYEQQFLQALGKHAEHCISNVPWYNPKAELTRRVEQAFQRQNPKDRLVFHGLNVGFTFEAVLIAADAFKRARSVEPKALADAIRQTNIESKMMLGAPIRFNAKGQVEGIGSACVQNLAVSGGTPRAGEVIPTVVLPAAAAEAKPVFPVPGYTSSAGTARTPS
jgi:branched-chain amino acid transport system substrate-binding protein